MEVLYISSIKTNISSSTYHQRKRNGLRIAFLNIVFLGKHKQELEIILRDNNIDILILLA